MFHVDGREYCVDPASGVLALLGKQWTLPLIGVLGNRPSSRFNELQDAIEGIGSKVLSRRLRELAELGLLERSTASAAGPHAAYRLTEAGTRLRGAILPLLGWASEPERESARAPGVPQGGRGGTRGVDRGARPGPARSPNGD